MRKDFTFIFWLLLLIVPASSATVQTVHGIGQSDAMSLSWEYPTAPVAAGESFIITLNVWTDDNTLDDVLIEAFTLYGDCTLAASSTADQDAFASQRYQVNMTGDACSFSATAKGLQNILGTLTTTARYEMAGTIVSHHATVPTSASDAQPLSYWLWTGGFLLLFLVTLWHSSGWAWLLPIMSSFLGLVSAQYGDAFPFSPMASLMLYAVSMFTLWWVSNKKEKLV